jgi:hypothetical protein
MFQNAEREAHPDETAVFPSVGNSWIFGNLRFDPFAPPPGLIGNFFPFTSKNFMQFVVRE